MRGRRSGGVFLGACLTALCAVAVAAPQPAFAAPSNDSYADASALSGALPLSATGTNVGATAESNDPKPFPASYEGHTVWFRWTASSNGIFTIGTCGTEFTAVLGVYEGGADSLHEVAANRYSFGPNCPDSGSEVTFHATIGTTLSIEVDSNRQAESAGQGAIALQITEAVPPVNDDFANAAGLSGRSDSTITPNWGATKENGEPDHRGDPGGSSVWFDWTAPRSGGVFLQACQEPRKTVIAAYTGDAVDALFPVTQLESNPDCILSFKATAGVTYRIAVDGQRDSGTDEASLGESWLYLTMVPLNDDFADAEVLGGGESVLYVGRTTIGATKEPGEPDHDGDPGGASAWFLWTAPRTGSLRLDACDATFPVLLAAYQGSALDGLTPIQGSEGPVPQVCGPSPSARLQFNVDGGAQYRIAADGVGGAAGIFDLDLEFSTERLPPEPVVEPIPAPLPQTTLRGKRVRARHAVAFFSLSSTQPNSTFRCRLDSAKFRACGPAVTYRHLSPGRHMFRAEAVDETGDADPEPLTVRFRIVPSRKSP